MFWTGRRAAASVALVALAACGSSSSSSSSGATSSATSAGSGGSSSTGSQTTGAQPVHVVLHHIPMGTATLTYDTGSGTLTVEVKLTGLAPNSAHPSHIHSGSCEAQGAVEYPLNAITADGGGNADVTSKVTGVKEGKIAEGGWYVNVHNGPGLAPAEQFEPIACGDVHNSAAAASVTVPLMTGPPGVAGQSASGTADLTLSGGSLVVVLTVHGLAPSSAHIAHIHSGSCESQGAVVYPLNQLAADANGDATSTTTIPNVSAIATGQWYVNVHRGPALTDQTGFDPVSCGDVGP
jgi:hypothetical protein